MGRCTSFLTTPVSRSSAWTSFPPAFGGSAFFCFEASVTAESGGAWDGRDKSNDGAVRRGAAPTLRTRTPHPHPHKEPSLPPVRPSTTADARTHHATTPRNVHSLTTHLTSPHCTSPRRAAMDIVRRGGVWGAACGVVLWSGVGLRRDGGSGRLLDAGRAQIQATSGDVMLLVRDVCGGSWGGFIVQMGVFGD